MEKFHGLFPNMIWLVVWTPLKNISQLGWLFPIYGKIKNVPNHQPDDVFHSICLLDFITNSFSGSRLPTGIGCGFFNEKLQLVLRRLSGRCGSKAQKRGEFLQDQIGSAWMSFYQFLRAWTRLNNKQEWIQHHLIVSSRKWISIP